MKVLRVLQYTLQLAFRRWALREINPLHPDLPRLVVEKARLRDLLRKELP
jgi:hypothetical protein